MSVDIEPLELAFRRPFTFEVSQTLTIKNPNTTPVAFKVKTTAPKQYCVRPNAGRIEPGQDFDVSVLLQAMKTEPPADAKCRDKFLVQSAPITGDKEFASIASVLDTSDKSSIQERKIRVVWLPAADDAQNSPPPVAVTPNRQSTTNGAADTPEASRTFASPSGGASSPESAAPPPYDDPKSEPEDVKAADTPKSAVSAAAASASATAKSTYDAAKEKVDPDGGLRQRVKSGSGSAVEGAKRTTAQLAQATPQHVQGVPVKIAALLCFLAFLVGYLFF